tara:strand:- start:124 stop:591 length:468 start_codon:yes stop_codon:yes gene_type:complete
MRNGFELDKMSTDAQPHPLYVDYRGWGSFNYKFTVVREPLDRFCSMLRYRQDLSNGKLKNEEIDAFAIDALNTERAKLDRVWGQHIPPQVEYHCDDMEFFRLEDGFEAVQKRLRLNTPFPTSNVSDSKVNVSFLSHATVRRVKEFYKDDYEKFGY